ncbi:MAG: hypothetical protein V1733_07340 [bacterium]
MKSNHNPSFLYPVDLVKNLGVFPLQHALPCSILFGDDPKAGILLICSNSDLKHFGINPRQNPEPFLKFRMLNIDKKAYAIEIHLLFDNANLLKIHLNPSTRSTIEFLQLGMKKRMISFHYFNPKTRFFASSITNLDEEEIPWFKRNFKLATKLPKTNNYMSVCTQLIFEVTPTQRLFHFYDAKKFDCFIKAGNLVAKFDDPHS